MDEDAVQAYVDHAEATIEAAPQMDEANTKVALLRDFLDLLDWTIPDNTQLEYSVKAFGKTYKVDYALILEGTSAVEDSRHRCRSRWFGGCRLAQVEARRSRELWNLDFCSYCSGSLYTDHGLRGLNFGVYKITPKFTQEDGIFLSSGRIGLLNIERCIQQSETGAVVESVIKLYDPGQRSRQLRSLRNSARTSLVVSPAIS